MSSSAALVVPTGGVHQARVRIAALSALWMAPQDVKRRPENSF